jgi:hypothetical protein
MLLRRWPKVNNGLFVGAGGGARAIGQRPGEVVDGTHKGGLVGTGDVYAGGGCDGGGWRDGFGSRCASVSTGGFGRHEGRGGPAANEEAMGHACCVVEIHGGAIGRSCWGSDVWTLKRWGGWGG